MFSLPQEKTSIYSIISYSVPRLHTGKSWYVDFQAYDPTTGKMRRKKYMLNAIKSAKERRDRANEIITNLNVKLRSGWNPWAQVESSRQYTPYMDVINAYHIYIETLHKKGGIKSNTLLDYQKRLRILNQYVSKRLPATLYVYQVDQAFINDFLDYVLLDRDASARTRNNYRTWISSLCSWMVEKQYLTTNPVEGVKSIAEGTKFRRAIEPNDLLKMKKYLKKSNPHYLLLCQFAYYTFIRPEEISNIRLSDIRLHEQKVFVAGDVSKNRKDGMVGLNDAVIRSMLDMDIFSYPDHFYLFGKDFQPSAAKASARTYRDYFRKLREKLHWPMEYQFYSLKDSGIRDLANAEGIVIARDQARHADISTTNRYLSGRQLAVHEETKHFKGEL